MYSCILPYRGKCTVKLTVDIHGNTEEIPNVLIDTGFTSGTTFGLKLPIEYSRFANGPITGYVKQADGEKVPVQYIPDAIIACIQGFSLERKICMSTFFMTGPASLGMLFLQRCRINFNGPEEKAIFEFDL